MSPTGLLKVACSCQVFTTGGANRAVADSSKDPNIESHATLWRTQYVDIGPIHGIRFAPGHSNSEITFYIIEAIRLSLTMIVLFLRALWWVAADVTNTCNVTPNTRTLLLGLPARTKRNKLCSCNSGQVTRERTHPEPEGLFNKSPGTPGIRCS